MNSFLDQDIRRLLSLWRGGITFKTGNDGINQLEMVKKYRLKVGESEETLTIKRVLNIMECYQFLTIEGNKEIIEVKATVKPNSIEAFEKFCNFLRQSEERNEMEVVA